MREDVRWIANCQAPLSREPATACVKFLYWTPEACLYGIAPFMLYLGPMRRFPPFVLSHLSLAIALAIFLILGSHQLQLPGLHYDEAKEAGLNAMQLVTGQPVTAFRDTTVQIGPWRLPLMVQDYIGALDPLLSVPFLALGGMDPADPARSVVALRWLPLLIGALTLWLTWLVARRLGGSLAATVAALLMAVNPALIFWSRQGVFVTNLTALFFMASLLTGLRWWRNGRTRDLCLTALFWGFGLYAKLLFIWAIGAMVVVAVVAWLIQRRRGGAAGLVKGETTNAQHVSHMRYRTCLAAILCFLLPLIPLIIFNLRTEGTITSVFGNLGHSYYGVNNRAYLANLDSRWGQLGALLRGDFFWYFGQAFGDLFAPWIFAGLLSAGLLAWLVTFLRSRRRLTPALPTGQLAFFLPPALLALIVMQSAFTVSDLFITHYVLLLPLLPLSAGVAVAVIYQALFLASPAADTSASPVWRFSAASIGRSALLLPVLAAVLFWAHSDYQTTLSYHQTLAVSGGAGDHSDAINELAAYLALRAPAAPLALDWGMDAPVRFLTVGRVNPVEVFGYTSLAGPDDGFAGRLAPFMDNPANLYLAHAPANTVFRGRVEALAALAAAHGMAIQEVAQFRERSGRPLFVVYRVLKTTS
jgi:Dolichyl-phosphate-mannose-protein mannosyltransferase